jgi:hypothetical protein
MLAAEMILAGGGGNATAEQCRRIRLQFASAVRVHGQHGTQPLIF